MFKIVAKYLFWNSGSSFERSITLLPEASVVYKKLTSFSMNYDTLINYDLRSEYNSINLYKVDGKVVVVNNYLEDKNGIEYDKHNLYIINKSFMI